MQAVVEQIASITRRGKAAYDDDVALRRAIERCLEILGEAAKSVSPELAASHSEIPWSDLSKVRDRLSHHYHRVDSEQLWVIATADVPALADALRVVASDIPQVPQAEQAGAGKTLPSTFAADPDIDVPDRGEWDRP